MPRLARVTYVERQPTGWTGPSDWFRGASMAGRYAAGVSVRGQWLSSSLSHLHDDERSSAPLNEHELTAMNRTRLFGATGTALMAIGALGAGARPVIQDPIFGVRLLNLPSRIQTVSLTMTTTGAVMMTLAWLMLGRFAIGSLRNKGPDGRPDGPRGPVRRMSRGQLDRTLLLWLLPLLVAPPMYSKDVYSYLAQSQIARLGKDPYTEAGSRPRAGPRVHALGAESVARNTCPVWSAVPVDR